MIKELLSIFRSGDPLQELADRFTKIMNLAEAVTLEAGKVYFGETPATPEQRTAIYKQDVKVNKLERKIRKKVIAHLTISGNVVDLPYGLLLMSLVKDVERIGDYAKNLYEVAEVVETGLPDDDIVAELREIRVGVEGMSREAGEVFSQSDREGAIDLINQGRDLAHRCDTLISRIARSDYHAGPTTATVLGTRYYKRIGGHLLNILSAVVMPLHKLDYYDEAELPDDLSE